MTTETSPKPLSFDTQREIDRQVRRAKWMAGGFLLVLLVLGTVIQLSSAVVAFGDVSVDSKVKKIAHPAGGVISAIYVRDGDRVRAGQLLMKFDSKVSGVTAQSAGKSLDQLLATQARLTAERDGAGSISFPAELLGAHTPSADRAMAEERQVFALRRAERDGQQRQLEEKITQVQQLIVGYRVQITTAQQELTLIQPELEGLRQLYATKFTTLNRLNELERTAVTLKGSVASLNAQIEQANAQLAELRQQILQLSQNARSEAGTGLADAGLRVSEQRAHQADAADVLDRSEIRAPQSGIVDKLAFSTVGGVVPPAQTILELVPDHDLLTIEAKVSPSDIDQVQPGQRAELRFTAFNVRTTPEILATVRRVSPERQTDERTGTSYYMALIDIPAGQLKRLGSLKLVPGMPVEAYIQTGRRSMLSYLVKPASDQLARSFRQD
jgi:HlyD family type I secretion membrane fusion protein